MNDFSAVYRLFCQTGFPAFPRMHLADIVSVMPPAGFAVLHFHGCCLLLVIAISASYSPLLL